MTAAAFRDRRDAGQRLAALVEGYRETDPVVVAMPRGGVPVAAEVARALRAPLDIVVVRKIGAPRNREFALGAVAEGGVRVISERALRTAGIGPGRLQALVECAEAELAEHSQRYRGACPPVPLDGRTAILVDDGLATGRSARAAIASLRQRGAAKVVLAVPVAAPASAEALRTDADVVIALELPPDLWAVGSWYEDFAEVSDEEVARLLGALTHSAQAHDDKGGTG
jgi:predicted phosphoribosyltransferase